MAGSMEYNRAPVSGRGEMIILQRTDDDGYTDVRFSLSSESNIYDLAEEFGRFLLALGYSSSNVAEIFDEEITKELGLTKTDDGEI
jgi:hypothetical protein